MSIFFFDLQITPEELDYCRNAKSTLTGPTTIPYKLEKVPWTGLYGPLNRHLIITPNGLYSS